MKARKIIVYMAYVYFTLLAMWVLAMINIFHCNMSNIFEPSLTNNALALSLVLLIVSLPVVTIFLVATYKPKLKS